MKPFYTFCMFLAIGLTVGGAPLQHGSGSGFQTLSAGGSFYGAQGDDGVVAYNGAAISLSQNNGKTEIYINGHHVDLDKATVVEENEQYKVLEPAGIPGARITINKANGQIEVDYLGAHYQTLTPEMANAQLTQAMLSMEEELKQMHDNLDKLFKGLPVGHW